MNTLLDYLQRRFRHFFFLPAVLSNCRITCLGFLCGRLCVLPERLWLSGRSHRKEVMLDYYHNTGSWRKWIIRELDFTTNAMLHRLNLVGCIPEHILTYMSHCRRSTLVKQEPFFVLVRVVCVSQLK